MCFLWLFLLIMILYLCKKNKESFSNCPMKHYLKQEKILKNSVRPMLGYNPNDYIYKTFLMESDEPLPVNANFWFHEY